MIDASGRVVNGRSLILMMSALTSSSIYFNVINEEAIIIVHKGYDGMNTPPKFRNLASVPRN